MERTKRSFAAKIDVGYYGAARARPPLSNTVIRIPRAWPAGDDDASAAAAAAAARLQIVRSRAIFVSDLGRWQWHGVCAVTLWYVTVLRKYENTGNDWSRTDFCSPRPNNSRRLGNLRLLAARPADRPARTRKNHACEGEGGGKEKCVGTRGKAEDFLRNILIFFFFSINSIGRYTLRFLRVVGTYARVSISYINNYRKCSLLSA